MKILIYGEHFLPLVGGSQTAMALLAEGLANRQAKETNGTPRQLEVTVVTRTPAGKMDDASVPYRIVRQPGFWRLARLVWDADVVHLAGPCFLPLVLGQLMRKPVVVEHHGYQAVCLNGMLLMEPSRTVCPGHLMQRNYAECLRCSSQTMGRVGGVRALLLSFPRRWLCKGVAANVTISDHVAARLKLPRSRTIYYGVKVAPPVIRTDRQLPSSIAQVAYVGRLVTEKGLPILLQAAKSLRDKGEEFQLTFIGDGPERSHLEELTKGHGLGDRVAFTGDLRGADLERAASKVDVVVMPSICEETAGLAAIEQMMRGRTVVASDIGGLSEVVGDAGWKFPPGDADALCDRLVDVLEHPQEAAVMGRRAREYALQRFAVDRMVEEHLSLYCEIGNQRHA